MKKKMKRNVIASIMVLGFLAVPVFAHNNSTTQPQQQMNGNMMGGGMMGSQGMQGRGMQGGGMMGQGNWNNMGCNGMMGGAMMNQMNPNQQQSFMDATTELRQKMVDLRFDYKEAMRNPDTDPKELAKIEKQMLDIRSQMMGKMENMQTK